MYIIKDIRNPLNFKYLIFKRNQKTVNMKKLIIILALFISSPIFSQNSLLSKVVDIESHPLFGQNRRHYLHAYIGYGFFFSDQSGKESSYNIPASRNFELGVRYKLKLCNYNAIGFQIAYNSNIYRVEDKGIYTNYKKQKLQLYNFSFSIYDRINFKKRGDFMGTFLDLGAYFDLPFAKTRIYQFKDSDDGERMTVSYENSAYLNKNNYGAYAQFGINKYVIFGKYRLSDISNDHTLLQEMPRITVGLQMGLYW